MVTTAKVRIVAQVMGKRKFEATAEKEAGYKIELAWLGGGTNFYGTEADFNAVQIGDEVAVEAEPFAEGEIRYRNIKLGRAQHAGQSEESPQQQRGGGIFGKKAA